LEASRGGPTRKGDTTTVAPKLSLRKQEQLMRENFISPRRVREWRDLYSQLHTVVAEHGWRLNPTPATYEQLHLSMLAGLLGNVGCKSDDDEWYLGARGIRFYRHPGVNLSKKPGRWIVAAELVETTRLYGRGIAAVEPQWLPVIGAHVLKKQLLEPHWEKKAAEVIALERATLYGIVVYNNRRVNFGNVDPAAAREIFIREALVAGEWDTRLPFVAANRKLIAQIHELEHKARRQDVLVDDELIHAHYDRHLPPEVCSGATLERWYRDESRRSPGVLLLTRDELMRHEAASVTASAYPSMIRLGGVDCAATYLHAPGDAKDGLTVTVPIYSLNQVNEDRCDWLVPGMLAEKVTALLKTLPQRPRSRLMPLAEFTAEFVQGNEFGHGPLLEVLLKAVRARAQLEVRRSDFKLELVAAHLMMNFRVTDEHGRQLGTGRNLAALKSEFGAQARSAFQALAALKAPAQPVPPQTAAVAVRAASVRTATIPSLGATEPAAVQREQASPRYTDWTFESLPELMEIRRGSQTLVGFPALIDKGQHVEIEVFDEPDLAQARHRIGLRRLFSLQLSDALKYLEKNIPDLQRMAAAYMGLGTSDELRSQIIEVAIDRAFLASPWPCDRAEFAARLKEGRSRLNLIAGEVARSGAAILVEYGSTTRKLRDARPPKAVTDDIAAQLANLVGKRFIAATPWAQLAHLPRYLKAIALRLEKQRIEPARDARLLAEIAPLEQAYWRTLAQRKGRADARLEEYRWLLEELRVGLFAQELRTALPVSVKRLERVWQQLEA
jgi:ATP-dependent helicase HrpA